MQTASVIASGLATALGGGLAVVGLQARDLRRRLQRTVTELAATGPATHALSVRLDEAHTVIEDLKKRLEDARVEDRKKEGWLKQQEEDIEWLQAELAKRPKMTRKTYKIVTVGVKWTGKTSLTLKWANPLIDLGLLEGTKIERYERTISHVASQDVTTEHVLEIGDWGGEHIVDAQSELIMDEIHGLLIVVDLGGKGATSVDQARIDDQIREFQPQCLKFFFGPKTVASCKTVVLFINKSDLLPGTPREIEVHAKQLYSKLISDLEQYRDKVDIHVLVGSASYGHSTHLLFSHFVEKILPKNAYDSQLLQRLKADLAPSTDVRPAAMVMG